MNNYYEHMIMEKNRFILLLMVVFTVLPARVSAQIVTRTIIDIETGMSIPYVYINNSDGQAVGRSNDDGVFTVGITPGLTYTFSQMGYTPLTVTAEQLLADNLIRMEMLPYELNTIIVTPDDALSDLRRALESTRKHIPSTPFFMRCYKKDVIVSGNDTLIDAKAIIDVGIIRLRSAGRGGMGLFTLKGLHIDYNNSCSEDIIPIANPRDITPINTGSPRKVKENIVYTRIDFENDSIIIIAWHPINYFLKGKVLSSGRFIIDAKTWCILRIDTTPDSNTIEYRNNLAEKRITLEHSVSVFYSANCLPLKVEQKTIFHLKDKPDELFTWTVLQVYKDISRDEYRQKPSGSYDWKKNILQQKPVAMPDFDAQFNRGFQ